MDRLNSLKNKYKEKAKQLFSLRTIDKLDLKNSIRFTSMIEEYISVIVQDTNFPFAIACAGSFCRRELSPFSDIDLMFIHRADQPCEEEITALVTLFWDAGLEVSHTVRVKEDINRFYEEDLKSYTQLYEIRYLMGARDVYEEFESELNTALLQADSEKIFYSLLKERDIRHEKYGNSPKVIEPNVKLSCGGLRDVQILEWIYSFVNKKRLTTDNPEETYIEVFAETLKRTGDITQSDYVKLIKSYSYLVSIRNILHILHRQRYDRFEFQDQISVAKVLGMNEPDSYRALMKDYFAATSNHYRFQRSFLKRYFRKYEPSVPMNMAMHLDDDFFILGDDLHTFLEAPLSMSDMLKACYYRGLHNIYFDDRLRTTIIRSIEDPHISDIQQSAFYFRKIIQLPHNVGKTLSVMNELGILAAFMPEFRDMVGFLQHGVYHCYTADEHTIKTIENLEQLGESTNDLGMIFRSMKRKELLYLAMIFHDIAKPVNIEGHNIMGAEIADMVLQRLGYPDEDLAPVRFLIIHHLTMSKVAFQRNLNDPDTLNSFISKFNSLEDLDALYLVSFADLSAVNPALWTSWKHDLLRELYNKSRKMLEESLSGEDLLQRETAYLPEEISRHSHYVSSEVANDHIESINDQSYTLHFSGKEIASHIEEILTGDPISVIFNNDDDFTYITVITRDFPALLSKICGVLLINDINIHDARIFTRKDGIAIDSFNLTDFRSQKPVSPEKYDKIKKDLKMMLSDILQLNSELKRMKGRWWRIESKLFRKQGKIKISFEERERYTIIDIHSPDRLGFLYTVTRTLNQLGLSIYFAKITTHGDEVTDSFYVLDANKQRVSKNYYDMITADLTEAIQDIL